VTACRLLALALLIAPGLPGGQSTSPAPSRLSRVEKLYQAGRYAEIVRLPPPAASGPASLDYYRGMAFAKLKQWSEAWQALRQGELKAPGDERFPVELAGVAFEQKDFSRARRQLHRALRLKPNDEYANNFLASLYYLDANLPAALKYWNRAGQPKIAHVKVDPPPRLKPQLLKAAMPVEPGAILTLPHYDSSLLRLDALAIFPQFRFELAPAPNDSYNVSLHAAELNGVGSTVPEALFSLLRGLPYDSIYPGIFNIHDSAVNVISLLRWDPNKQRIFWALSGPVDGSARTRYQLYLDARKEYWDISSTFFGSASPVTDLGLKKIEGGAELLSVVSDRLTLRGGIDLSGRSFSNFTIRQSSAAAFFTNGLTAEAEASAGYRLAEMPDHRLTLDSTASLQAGHDFAAGLQNFAQAEGGLSSDWLPEASGDDYEMTAQVRAGQTFGMVPFDELFMLGLERDNDLWLRGHIGTFDGRKGSAPLGRDYTLTNWEDDKIIYQNGIFRVRLGPFLDSGRIRDPSGDFGSRGWLWDTGLELKIRVLGGTEVALFFGKDLLTGRTSFYATTLGYLNGPFPPGPAPFRGD
jgi:tetratricopeptide (TPR) repeat protein